MTETETGATGPTSEKIARGRNAARVRAAKGRRRLGINLAIAVIVLAVIAIVLIRRADQPKGVPGLVTGTAERMDLTQSVSATGSVTAQTGAMVKIGSQITGRIKRLFADVGTQMKAGDVIAELDVPDLQAQVQQAEATLGLNRDRLAEQVAGVQLQSTQSTSDLERARSALVAAQASDTQVQRSADLQRATAEAGVRQAKANAVNSDASLKRTQQLFQKGYVAAADVDTAKAQAEVNAAQLSSAQENQHLVNTKLEADLESARQQVKQAEAALRAAQAGLAQNTIKQRQVAEAGQSVKQSEAALAQSRAQLAKAFIRTPISGTVLQLTQQQGETIAAGLSAPTLIVVADLNRLQVDAFVDETDIGRVRLGQTAEITLDAYPDRKFKGRVAKIASGATMQQNVVTYDVTIALESPEHFLKPDMTATVNIIVARHENVLAVPIDAVKQDKKGPTVTLMTEGPRGQSEFKPVSVKTGISDGDRTEIMEGLKEGDVVVVSGQLPGQERRDQGPSFMPFGPRGGGRGGGHGR
jgi:RND family efflux transporter MFP subunit